MIELKWLEALDPAKASAVLKDLLRGIERVEGVEFFEDGVAADLHDQGIVRASDAYMQGRLHAFEEVALVIGEALLAHNCVPAQRNRQEELK